jgi:glycosyltransferase involved in cell wall biosynthesis
MQMGHHVAIATLDGPHSEWLRDWPAEIIPLGPARHYYRYSPRLIPWLREHSCSFDVIIINGTWRYSSLAVWLALRGSRTPYFLYSHGMLDPYFRSFPWKEFKKTLFWLLFEHRVFRDARAVVFTSDEERCRARNRYWPYRIREAVVRYGIAPVPGAESALREAFYDRFPSLRGTRLLLFIGRLHPTKGCDLLIEAVARVAAADPSFHLLIVGPDEVSGRRTLTRRAQRLGIADRITWFDGVYDSFKWSIFYASEAFLLPSHRENFCIAAAEALACGKPVIITDKVGVSNQVQRYGAGIVVSDTLDSFASGLRDYLRLGPEERQPMKVAARRCYSENFSSWAAASSLLDTFKEFGIGVK